MEGGLEGGQGKKGKGGNDAIFGGRGGGRYYAVRVRCASVPPSNNVLMTRACVRPPGDNVVMTNGGAGGKEGSGEL